MTTGTGEQPAAAPAFVSPDTDDADPRTVLAVLSHCAAGWVPEARLVGNVRAGDIKRACDAALVALMQADQASNACGADQDDVDYGREATEIATRILSRFGISTNDRTRFQWAAEEAQIVLDTRSPSHMDDVVERRARALHADYAPYEPWETVGEQRKDGYRGHVRAIAESDEQAGMTLLPSTSLKSVIANNLRIATDWMNDRDGMGRAVHEAKQDLAYQDPDDPNRFVSYDDLSEAEKECDRQIGEQIARQAVSLLIEGYVALRGAA